MIAASVRRGLVAAAVMMLFSSCADEGPAREIVCQQGLVEAVGRSAGPKTPRQSPMAAAFVKLSQGYERMPLDGCSEGQIHNARALSREAKELARMAEKIGPALEAEAGLQ